MNRILVVTLIAIVELYACTSGEPGSPPALIGTPSAGTGASNGGTLPPVTGASGTSGTLVGGGGASGSVAVAIAGSSAPSGIAGTTMLTAGSSAGTTGASGVMGAAGVSAGSGGSAGESAGSGGGGAGGASGGAKQGCLKDPKNVVFIGDSYINYIVAHPELNGLVAADAIKDGALMTGQNYTDYAVPGTTIAAGAPAIPGQWTQAKAANPGIQVVVMDGGGNDVLINNMQCKNAGAEKDATCMQVVANTLAAATKMITDMKASGVKEVVYFMYPHAPTGGADIDDYTVPMIRSMCTTFTDAMFNCRVIDLVPIFNPHTDWYASDGIHANAMGEAAIADQIWMTLKSDCAAQAASSGCCTP